MTGEEEGAKSDESGDSWRRYGGRLQCAPASDSACRRRQPSAFGAARCGSKGLTEREEVAVWAQRMKPEEAGPNHHQKKKKKKYRSSSHGTFRTCDAIALLGCELLTSPDQIKRLAKPKPESAGAAPAPIEARQRAAPSPAKRQALY